VVSGTGKILYSSSADQDNAVLLKIVSLTRDVACYFDAVGKTYPGDLSQSGVRLLRGGSLHSGAHASLLRRRGVGHTLLQRVVTLLKSRCRRLLDRGLSSFSN
jgi:hypothetical protein